MTIPVPRETGRSGIMRAVTDLLTAERVWWMRCNSGAMRYGKNRLMRWGRVGMADLLALVRLWTTESEADGIVYKQHHRFVPALVPLWLEIKRPGERITAEQQAFREEVEAEGHLYLIIEDAAELQAWLKGHKA